MRILSFIMPSKLSFAKPELPASWILIMMMREGLSASIAEYVIMYAKVSET
jgi:hypothetical protein